MKKQDWHKSQRGHFAGKLRNEMLKNKDIIFLTGDLGYKMLDEISGDFPERFINCGASEQAMMGIAVGLAQEGKIPVVYTITSFFLRCAETIHLYLNEEKCPVIMVGAGRGADYKEDGISHYAFAAEKFIKSLKNIQVLEPEIMEDGAKAVTTALTAVKKGPVFVSLRR